MNSFYCYTPNPHCLTRPCFPKASAKVDTFTVIAKRFSNKNQKIFTNGILHLIYYIKNKKHSHYFLFHIEYSTFVVNNQCVIIQQIHKL